MPSHRRDLLTHDVRMLTADDYARMCAGRPMPGVVEVRRAVAVRRAIKVLALLVEASREDKLEGQVLYLPPR